MATLKTPVGRIAFPMVTGLWAGWLAVVGGLTACSPPDLPAAPTATAPSEPPVKLVFIHHSCGENWLADSNGGLGRALAENNFFVSDTNYGWGPDQIGDRTDIGDWPQWFTGPRSRAYTQALYRESGQHCAYTRTAEDPGGENRIVLFKSCFPNSALEGEPTDAPARGEGLTVANAKAIYNELLGYFATQPERLFVVVTAPPLQDPAHARNASALNRWLVEDWLADYPVGNVVVFDFHHVLTDPKNHHRFHNGKIEYACQAGKGTLYYAEGGDDHPTSAGNRKATEEFVSLLNHWYGQWEQRRPKAPSTGQPAAMAPPPDSRDLADGASRQAAPVLSPESDSQTQPGAASASMDGFESGTQAWAAFLDTEKETRLTFVADRSVKHGGAASLRIEYDLAPESWAACGRVPDRPQDWSHAKGLTLFVHAEKPGVAFAVVAYGGNSAESLLHFECACVTTQAAVDGWQRFDIPWSRFAPPEWQGTSEKYHPRSAMGVAVALHSATARETGRLWLDDVGFLQP